MLTIACVCRLCFTVGYNRCQPRQYSKSTPASVKPGKKQQTALQANRTRVQTFGLRNVCERTWARLKQWRMLSGIMNMYYALHCMDFARIAAATINRFFPPLSQDTAEHTRWTNRIIAGLNTVENPLKVKIEGTQFTGLCDSQEQFIDWLQNDTEDGIPFFVTENIWDVCMGKYSCKLSYLYCCTHFDNVKILHNRQYPNIFKFQGIKSRFASAKTRQVCLEFNDENLDGLTWYCTCKSGARTTNPCGHAAAALRYIWLSLNNVNVSTITTPFKTKMKEMILDCKKYALWKKDNKRHCLCGQPESETDGLPELYCSKCQNTYHAQCLELTEQEVIQIHESDESWWCPGCDEAIDPSLETKILDAINDPNNFANNSSNDNSNVINDNSNDNDAANNNHANVMNIESIESISDSNVNEDSDNHSTNNSNNVSQNNNSNRRQSQINADLQSNSSMLDSTDIMNLNSSNNSLNNDNFSINDTMDDIDVDVTTNKRLRIANMNSIDPNSNNNSNTIDNDSDDNASDDDVVFELQQEGITPGDPNESPPAKRRRLSKDSHCGGSNS